MKLYILHTLVMILQKGKRQKKLSGNLKFVFVRLLNILMMLYFVMSMNLQYLLTCQLMNKLIYSITVNLLSVMTYVQNHMVII